MSFTALRANPGDFALYIGLQDVTGNNMDYQWVRDGTNLTFPNWGLNQPSSMRSRCAAVSANLISGREVGKWVDVGCDESFGSICETDRVSQLTPIAVVTPSVIRHMG